MSKAIELVDVDKRFATKKGEVEALSGVSFDVAQGEFIAIVGASGCGKSTLLRIIGGLMPRSGGQVRVNGDDVVEPSPEIGMAFQSPVLLPWRTVRRNIEIQLEVRRLRDQIESGYVDELIDLVGLKGFEDSRPYELSGGMQQRIALCRALVHEPALLLMDEPFGALDAMTREQMNLELQRIWMETRKTVVLVTHSIMEAVFLADRIVVLSSRPGRVKDIVPVTLERPRDFSALKDPVFQDALDRVRAGLEVAGMSD